MKDRRRDRREGKRKKKYKQLLDDLKEKRRYWNLIEEELDHTDWRTCFGTDSGTLSRQTIQ
jgi:hypothetical protein